MVEDDLILFLMVENLITAKDWLYQGEKILVNYLVIDGILYVFSNKGLK